MATSTTSASMVSALPPAAGSKVSVAPLPRVLHLGDLGAELELEALLPEDALELLGDLAVHAGQDAVEILDHRHLGAEAAPHRAELQADHAGADDDEALRHALELERAGGGHHDLLVDLDARQAASRPSPWR